MNTQTMEKKPSLSEDLTIVFLRGNGSPRSFRVSVKSIQRSILTLSLLLVGSVAIAVLFLGLNFIHSDPLPTTLSTPREQTNPSLNTNISTTPQNLPTGTLPTTSNATKESSSEAAGKQGISSNNDESEKPGLWAKLTNAVKTKESESEQAKEIAGLQADIAALNEKLENRKVLENNSEALLSFMGPKSSLMNANESNMKIQNIRVTRDEAKKEFIVDFDLQNIDPNQRQIRGYIVVLGKSPDAIVSYPQNLFTTNQNVLINFTKGETFAVSRFRQARANVSMLGAGKKVDFQILLFSTDGRILNSMHVEEQK